MRISKKTKVLSIVIIVIFTALIIGLFHLNTRKDTTPINMLISAIEEEDSSKISKCFHDYCSMAMVQNTDENKFNEYIEKVKSEFGNDVSFTYKVLNKEDVSDDYLETYETNAKYTFADYPYLKDGNNLNFQAIYKINVEMKISGSKKVETGEIDFFIVKIDGKYYFLHQPNIFISQFLNY